MNNYLFGLPPPWGYLKGSNPPVTKWCKQSEQLLAPFVLHTQYISHGLGGFFLGGGGNMGVGVQSEASGEVSEHA